MSADATTDARWVAEAAQRELEKQHETDLAKAAVKMARGGEMERPPLRRLRLSTSADGTPSVDLSKADRDCPRCGGMGTRPSMQVQNENGDRARVPVICMCVHRNGGVKEDMLDRMLAGAAKKH